jgi:hypothetical protein
MPAAESIAGRPGIEVLLVRLGVEVGVATLLRASRREYELSFWFVEVAGDAGLVTSPLTAGAESLSESVELVADEDRLDCVEASGVVAPVVADGSVADVSLAGRLDVAVGSRS